MLRLETPTGYYLITHPDHAHLAGRFAEQWGNSLFLPPTPRQSVLHGIHVHDDGWLARDASPAITRQGKPSAFSVELVGKYSAFEEIDLAQYLAVRESAVQRVEQVDRYAALIVSMHTYNLLTERADRTTIAPDDLPLLDDFLNRQRLRQEALHKAIKRDPTYAPEEATSEAIFNNFRLLQACDNLSLLSCVAYTHPATLLHPLPTVNSPTTVTVEPIVQKGSARHFRLNPYPFNEPALHFQLPARHVEGHTFASSQQLSEKFYTAPIETLEITLTA
jgi:hypothetical protein